MGLSLHFLNVFVDTNCSASGLGTHPLGLMASTSFFKFNQVNLIGFSFVALRDVLKYPMIIGTKSASFPEAVLFYREIIMKH